MNAEPNDPIERLRVRWLRAVNQDYVLCAPEDVEAALDIIDAARSGPREASSVAVGYGGVIVVAKDGSMWRTFWREADGVSGWDEWKPMPPLPTDSDPSVPPL